MSTTSQSNNSPKSILALHDLSEHDLSMIREFGKIIEPKLDQYVSDFYLWLDNLPEFRQYFSDANRLKSVQASQLQYWKSFFEADVNDDYIARRREIGEVHARVRLPLPTYFASMNTSMTIFTSYMAKEAMSSEQYATLARSFTKLLHLDTTLVVESYSKLINKRITEQSEALLAMSTPVTMIWQDILMLPIVGIIDSKRAQDIMAAVLNKIAEHRAKIFIMDISGVAVIDTAVANHFIKITKATKLMGCECMVSGVSPAIAQTMVQLGVNVEEVRTSATLRDALEKAFSAIGLKVDEIEELRHFK